jgi:hypothetical protein
LNYFITSILTKKFLGLKLSIILVVQSIDYDMITRANAIIIFICFYYILLTKFKPYKQKDSMGFEKLLLYIILGTQVFASLLI